jgi:hypothetical protein
MSEMDVFEACLPDEDDTVDAEELLSRLAAQGIVDSKALEQFSVLVEQAMSPVQRRVTRDNFKVLMPSAEREM